MSTALTPKQQAFVLAYIGPAKGNATEAARMAGYSERTARSTGAENLHKPAIAEAIKAAGRPFSRLDRNELQGWLEDVIEGKHKAAEMRDRVNAATLLATVRGYLLKPDLIREQLQELKPRMSREAYRELLLALQGE